MQRTILVTGASGQIGTELVPALVSHYGNARVIASDIREPATSPETFRTLDCLDRDAFEKLVRDEHVTDIYHLVSILSARGEQDPQKAWELNMGTLRTTLDLAHRYHLRVFWPSSIAAFGLSTPKEATPQDTIMEPTTMYGITKRTGELLANYYARRLNVDVRSVRYPGLVSFKQEPGGGTTDYAVAIFYEALKSGSYTCFVREDTTLPMMYMDDAIRAAILLMDAPAETLSVRTSYNLAAESFSAGELAESVRAHVPNLTVTYEPDERQRIADSWPRSVDDSVARRDWGWAHEFDLAKMTEAMLSGLRERHE